MWSVSDKFWLSWAVAVFCNRMHGTALILLELVVPANADWQRAKGSRRARGHSSEDG